MAALAAGAAQAEAPLAKTPNVPPSIESLVLEAFRDAPVMLRVARCESTMRQFNLDGTVLHGAAHYADTGLFQINMAVHADEVRALGVDVGILEGNIAAARYLYDHGGLAHWAPSRRCWDM